MSLAELLTLPTDFLALIVLVAVGVSYLLGSIPYGLVLCKLFGYGDIRQIGSGNIGATNVLRTGNKVLALMTLIADIGKGAFAIWLCNTILTPHFNSHAHTDVPTLLLCTAGLFAIVGHNFPVWLKFQGGKGVATTFGTVLMLSPTLAGGLMVTWLLVAFITRYSSLSALVAFVSAPVWAYVLGRYEWGEYVLSANHTVAVTMGILALLGMVQHRENITRLWAGTETKIGQKK